MNIEQRIKRLEEKVSKRSIKENNSPYKQEYKDLEEQLFSIAKDLELCKEDADSIDLRDIKLATIVRNLDQAITLVRKSHNLLVQF